MFPDKPVFTPQVQAELVYLQADLDDLLLDLLNRIESKLDPAQKATILHDFEHSHEVLERYGVIWLQANICIQPNMYSDIPYSNYCCEIRTTF